MSSPFANLLREMMEYNGLRTTEEWTQILAVKPGVVETWLCDEAIPSSEKLRGVVSVLMEDTRIPDDLIERFEVLVAQPSAEVSPHAKEMGLTVGHYMTKVLREAFMRTLDTIHPEFQERVLLEACKEARLLRQARPTSFYRRRSLP